MTAAAARVGRFYTAARRHPWVLGKVADWKIPLGPYTPAQIAVAVGGGFLLIKTICWWSWMGICPISPTRPSLTLIQNLCNTGFLGYSRGYGPCRHERSQCLERCSRRRGAPWSAAASSGGRSRPPTSGYASWSQGERCLMRH